MKIIIEYEIDYDEKNGSCDTVELELPANYTEADVIKQLIACDHIHEWSYRSFEYRELL